MTKNLFLFTSVVATISAMYAVFRFVRQVDKDGVKAVLQDQYLLMTDAASSVVPSSSPSDDGFSNFARRNDLSEAYNFRLATGPIPYGLVLHP